MTPALAQLALVVVVAGIAVSAAELPVPHREPPRGDSPPGEAGASRGEPTRDDTLSRESENLLRAEWVRAGLNTNRPTWGLRGGLLWGLPPVRGPSPDGPRGLIRLRYPVLPGGEYDLINFIAIEPVVSGRKGFSELESSQLDGVPGKRLWAAEADAPVGSVTNLVAGTVTRFEAGVERLTVGVGVERFENGAHVGLALSQRSDAPDELDLVVHPQARQRADRVLHSDGHDGQQGARPAAVAQGRDGQQPRALSRLSGLQLHAAPAILPRPTVPNCRGRSFGGHHDR